MTKQSRAREIAEFCHGKYIQDAPGYREFPTACERAIQLFAREMAEKIRANNPLPTDEVACESMKFAARLILDAAGVTEGSSRDE